MARKRDPRREQAKQMFLESNGKKLLKDIAKEFGVSDSQIRKWKSLDKWDGELNGNATNSKGNVTKQKGAPIGNQNAKGNRGNSRASPPPGNKNAVKTGEYETIFADTLTKEEREIYSGLSDDPLFVLSEEIRLLKIRQHRMMNRIKAAENGLDQKEVEQLHELRGRKQFIDSEKGGKKVSIEVPAMVITEKREKIFRKIEDILAIEEALTRISAQLTRAVKQLNDLNLTEKRMALMDRQITRNEAQTDYTKAQTTRALINKDSDESDGGTVINIIDDIR
ncbi:phage terminase small subunit [Enterococcus sp. AZ109]|uniref:phage terminase small subunit n=1 Tax=Enterococcus sp. AZ109 TaxID=2774634 RepID=UPI003F1F33B8